MLIFPNIARNYSHMASYLERIPMTNPIVIDNYNIEDNDYFAKIISSTYNNPNGKEGLLPYEIKENLVKGTSELLKKYKIIVDVITQGYSSGTSSTQGYSIYTGQGRIKGYDYIQLLTLVRSDVTLIGQSIAIKWEASYIEWSQYNNYTNSGSINDPKILKEMTEEKIKLSQMLNGSNEDKMLAMGILESKLECK